MFGHNFKYAFLTLLKNKMLIFWTFAFPIIMGVFFYMAFSNIENSEKLDIIDIAIVDNDNFNNSQAFKETFKTLSDDNNEDRLFKTTYVSEEVAGKLLSEDKISGYLVLKEEPKVIVKESGINETILKYVVEEIIQTEDIIENVVNYKLQSNQVEGGNLNTIYADIYAEVLKMQEDNEQIKNIDSGNLSYIMIEYYTLIAMAALYGGIFGMVVINQNLANMSNNGKRVAISPISKGKLILSSVVASYLMQIIGLILLFLFTIFVLKVDYGENLLFIVLTALVGAFAGLSLGIAVASLFKTNENTKTGIIIAVTMMGCFLSGMMGPQIKYMVDKNMPILNKINPASMITDAFYSLYYYDTMN
ncbi:MAG: ABC transporter permease, partial [Bacilli bacterium]|nr:ABC transporter permease [Bacilli bacterium]